jgi:hypothetical protein
MSVNDLVHVGFTAVIFGSDDLTKLPKRIQNEVRAAKITALEEIERPLDKIEFGDRHPFGRKQHDELERLRAEHSAAGQSVTAPITKPKPEVTPAADGSSSFAPGGVPFTPSSAGNQ